MADRKHLAAREVERLITATRGSRTELRDSCLILLMFRHGLRVSEACALKLHQVDRQSRGLHVDRLKKGLSTIRTRFTATICGPTRPGSPSGCAVRRQATRSSSLSGDSRSTAGPLESRSGVTANWPSCPSWRTTHAAPRLRLRARRLGCGYPAHPGLPGASQHPAHRALHGNQPGAIRAAVAVKVLPREILFNYCLSVFLSSKMQRDPEFCIACKGA